MLFRKKEYRFRQLVNKINSFLGDSAGEISLQNANGDHSILGRLPNVF